MKNLQTNIYLALFSDFEYLVPSQSYKIFIRISSEKTYCKPQFIALRLQISTLTFQALIQLSQASSQLSQASNWHSQALHQPSQTSV